MKITLKYSVMTKEGVVIPNVFESFQCEDTDDSKKDARARFQELKAAQFIFNLEYKIEDVPTRRVVKARYAPNGKTYTFEVDFSLNPREGFEVDDLDMPGRRVYVFATEKDKVIPESELGFDVRRLRRGYKAS